MSEVKDELDYSKKSLSAAEYKFLSVTQQSGGENLSVGSSNNFSEFVIPSYAFNPSMCELSYTSSPTGPNTYNWMFRDCLPGIHRIEAFFQMSREYAMDLNFVANFTKATAKARMNVADLRTKEPGYAGSGVWGDMLAPCEGLTSTNLRYAIADATPLTGSVNYIESKYLIVGSSTTTPVQNMKVKLGDLLDTFFQLNKVVRFPEPLIVRITWNPVSYWGSSGTSATCDKDGAAALSSIALTNLRLFVAQADKEVDNLLKNTKVEIPISYPHVHKTNMPGSDQSVILNIPRSHGRTVKRIVHAVFRNSESLSLRFDHNNINGAKYGSYYSVLNGERLQPFDIRASYGEDSMIHRHLLRGKVLALNSNVFQYNAIHLDDFSGFDESDNLIAGKVIPPGGLQYEFNAKTCTDTFNHYDFVICQKVLHVSPSGVKVD